MKTIEFNNTKIKLSAELVDKGVNFPNSNENTLHNKFEISVQIKQERATFNFYDSQYNYENRITELEDLTSAFYCILSDATAGDMEFEDFCSEFGYSDDSIKALNIHKSCIEAKDSLTGIMPQSWDLYDLLNHLQEEYDV